MVKQLMICIGLFVGAIGVNAQDVNKGSLQAGSSTIATAESSVRGWVGNKVTFVETDLQSTTSGINNSGKAVELANMNASLFPNPVVSSSKLEVKDFNGSYTIRIFDNQGRNSTPNYLLGKSFRGSSMDIDFSAFPAGAYLVEVKSLDGEKGRTIKIVKNN